MIRKTTTLAIVFMSLFIGVGSCFTFDGDFNYQTESLGVVHFSQDITSTQLDSWNDLTRFQVVVWNGNNRHTLAVDVSNGSNVTFTGLQANVVIYDVAAAGAATQEIYYQGKGRPSEVDGGTYVMDGDNVVVTTNGNTVVTIRWNPNAVLIADDLMVALGVMALIPLVIGAVGLQAAVNGNLDSGEFTKIAMAVAGSVVLIFIIGLIASKLYTI